MLQHDKHDMHDLENTDLDPMRSDPGDLGR
jgi:hypothetical protein